jgi:hypothetical protein
MPEKATWLVDQLKANILPLITIVVTAAISYGRISASLETMSNRLTALEAVNPSALEKRVENIEATNPAEIRYRQEQVLRTLDKLLVNWEVNNKDHGEIKEALAELKADLRTLKSGVRAGLVTANTDKE